MDGFKNDRSFPYYNTNFENKTYEQFYEKIMWIKLSLKKVNSLSKHIFNRPKKLNYFLNLNLKYVLYIYKWI